MIFQWESQSATAYLKQLLSKETIAKIRERNPEASYMDLLSIGNGAIRPAGESYRNQLSKGIYQDNGHKALNDFMKPTLGYCIEENQNVSCVGKRKPIKDIKIGDKIYTKNGVSVVTNKFDMGEKPTVKISTQYTNLVCTKDHKVFTQNGWKQADDLTLKDSVAVRVGNANSKTYDKYKLKLIGYLLGDGILTQSNNVGFVNADINVVNDFADLVTNFDDCTTSIKNRRSRVNKTDLYYVNVKHKFPRKYKTAVSQYLFDIGLKTYGGGKNAREKFVPDFVFELNTESILTLLGAYTDTDCSVKNRGVKAVCYKTSSEKLCDGIIELIRLVGFAANKYYDKSTDAYSVVLIDAPRYLKTLYKYSFKIRRNYTMDELDYCKPHVNLLSQTSALESIEKAGIGKKNICRLTGINFYVKHKFVTVNSLKKIQDIYPNTFPNFLFNENIIWFPIKKVEENGIRKVYDISVKDEHNFLAENIIVHNCVYQEQVIEFLHSFCGYTMGQADVVRRGFAKKTGTEKFIPDIKKGFIKTMKEKYNVEQDEAEKLIVNFIQVIEDASSYLFSKNHSDPYSWIGYICGYLRYYYPLEFITTALNIFEDKEEKTIAIIAYAKKRGIKICPIKFRYSTAKYSFDKESNSIFKGISSIKFMNDNVANEMYELRNNQYKSFFDLLIDLKNKTTLNARQLNILIELDFFEEFGEANKLKYLAMLFSELYGKKQIRKEKIEKLKLSTEVFSEFNETPAMFTQIDSLLLLQKIADNLPEISPRKLKDKIVAQVTHLGYIDVVDNRYSGMATVVSIDTKYSPKVKMYSLKNGTTLDCKIEKKIFNREKLKDGDIVRISKTKNKPKVRKNAEGDWETIQGTSELWITAYHKVDNL